MLSASASGTSTDTSAGVSSVQASVTLNRPGEPSWPASPEPPVTAEAVVPPADGAGGPVPAPPLLLRDGGG